MELYSNNSASFLLKDEIGEWYTIYDGSKRGYPSVVSKVSFPIMTDVLVKYSQVDAALLEHLKEEMIKAGVKFKGAAN